MRTRACEQTASVQDSPCEKGGDVLLYSLVTGARRLDSVEWALSDLDLASPTTSAPLPFLTGAVGDWYPPIVDFHASAGSAPPPTPTPLFTE